MLVSSSMAVCLDAHHIYQSRWMEDAELELVKISRMRISMRLSARPRHLRRSNTRGCGEVESGTKLASALRQTSDCPSQRGCDICNFISTAVGLKSRALSLSSTKRKSRRGSRIQLLPSPRRQGVDVVVDATARQACTSGGERGHGVFSDRFLHSHEQA